MSDLAKEETGLGKPRKSDAKYWINTAITIALMWGIGYLSPWGSLSPLGMKVLGIFIGLLYGWTTIGFVWPSLMGVIALGLSGYQTVPQVLSAGFGAAQNTVVCFFLFVFAAYMDRIGLSHIIANWFISRKFCVGRPYVLVLMIFIAAYVLGATISLFTAILLLFSIFYNMCETLGYKKLEKFPVAVLCGIVYSAMLGFAVFPFKAVQILVLSSLGTASGGLTVDFGAFTVTMFVVTVACLAAYMAFMRFIVRPDMSNFDGVGDMFEELRHTKMNQEQKIAAGFLVFFMIEMFIPSVLPSDWTITKIFTNLSIPGSLALVIMLMAMLKIRGKVSFNYQDCATLGTNWDMIIMFVATMPISSAMSDSKVGVVSFLVDLLSPIMTNFSGLAFCVVFLALSLLLTQVAHNLVLAALLTPILYQFCVQLGADPLLMCTLFSFAIATAVATPGGSATAALMFTNDWIGRANSYKYGWTMAAISLVMVVVVGLSVGTLIFGL
jgi:solute carrier family 13 (sodium-dependent dicarboxylate transporter), member 2/3/5